MRPFASNLLPVTVVDLVAYLRTLTGGGGRSGH